MQGGGGGGGGDSVQSGVLLAGIIAIAVPSFCSAFVCLTAQQRKRRRSA
jgi:hypothetical protein